MPIGIKTQLDSSYAEKVKQQFNSFMQDLDKGSKIDLSLNVDNVKDQLTSIKGNFNTILEEYQKLGKTSVVPKFDENGNLKSFQIQLEQVSGIIDKINYKISSQHEYLDKGHSNLADINFVPTSVTEINKADELANQIADKQEQRLLQRQAQEKAFAEQQITNAKATEDAEISNLGEQVQAEQKIQDAIGKTIAKRDEEVQKLEKNQSTAINKALEEQYQTQTKEANRVSNLGELKGTFDSSIFSKSDTEIQKYIKSLYDANAEVVNLTRSYNTEGTEVVKATVNTRNHRGEIASEQIVLDKNSESVYKNSSAIKEMDMSMSGLGSRLKNAVQSFLSFSVVMGSFYAAIHQMQQGISFINELNTAQTNIQMITGKSSQETQQLTKDYSDLASQLSETTSSIMTASQEFLRAGNNEKDTAELLKSSTVLSKIAGQSQQDSAQSLISIMNSYHLSAEQMMGVVDKMVAVDNTSATSTAELSTAIQKVASSASNAGVSLPQLISYIGTISSVTRQSADTIGTAITFGGLVA